MTAVSGRKGTGNYRYRRNRQLVLAASDICGICGHPGSRTADHIIPAKLWPRDVYGQPLPGMDEPANLQPAHGTLAPGLLNRCPTCGKLCNQIRNAGPRPRRPASRRWL
jgi:hypothetical protein